MVACSCSESFDKLNSSLSTHSSFEDVTVLTEGVRQMTSSECIKKPTYAESYLGELRYSYPEGVVEEVRPSSPEDLAATTKKLAEIFGIEPSEVAMPPKKTYSDGFDRKSIAELFGLPYTEDVPTPSFIEETPTLEKVEEVSKLNQSVEEGYVNKEETSEERSQAARRPAVRYSDKFILILVFGLVFTHISQFVGFLSPYFAIFFNSVLYVFSEVCQFCSKNRTSTFLFGIATAAVFYPLHVIAILYVEIILKLIWCLWPGLWYNFDMCE
ncbi:unnamed protein product [Caenorhabditis auriculariae]|uniref:Uncharacterized protein n=1 Tax=Caenorhabditis auriculariae TaxID=2777116 RepID=A0A8S1HYU3_9PELO|nr:unnamed protein product [Caenorhabditis auriculariae]